MDIVEDILSTPIYADHIHLYPNPPWLGVLKYFILK